VRIAKARVEGFRLLEDVEIMLEPDATIIVGRNNSGKTSLTDVFDRFAGDGPVNFRLEDFSAGMRKKFYDAWGMRKQGDQPEDVLAALPRIVVTLTFQYDLDTPDFGSLSPFVIDLDPLSSTAIAKIEYGSSLGTLEKLFDIPPVEEGQKEVEHFYRSLKETLPKAYGRSVTAVDPTDADNRRLFDGMQPLTALVQCNLIRAQRALDHAKQGDPDVIGKLLSTLFKTASAPSAAAADQQLSSQLKTSVQSVEHDIQQNFDEMLKGLLPALEVFGFPGLNDTELHPETHLNVEALLTDHTKIAYAGADGVNLPEGYNGLGTRNLIYMLLQLESYHKAYRAKATRPGTHLIFIEEPEAHLHPQMQEVFIAQLNQAVKKLSEKYADEPTWPVQFVISTHSSHVANAAPFDAIRYFLNEPYGESGDRHTKVKDFKKGADKISQTDREFLHQYMTLTKCDLYFADKAILIEGATERILMPRFCAEVDKTLQEKTKLARQYLTTVEVGGAYSHLFYPLLDFLELKTLIITDLDAVRAEQSITKKGKTITSWVKCPVAKGERTSNSAIREWFRSKPAPENDDQVNGAVDAEPQATPQQLAGNNGDDQEGAEVPVQDQEAKKKPAPQRTLKELASYTTEDKGSGVRRIAYQIPEDPNSDIVGRSFEDALVLANLDRFELEDDDDVAAEAWQFAQNMPKAETALRFAIQEEGWTVPRYIREGLQWLSEPPPPPAQNPPVAPSTPSDEVEAN